MTNNNPVSQPPALDAPTRRLLDTFGLRARPQELTQLRVLPPRPAHYADWPHTTPHQIRQLWCTQRGIEQPWQHQAQALEQVFSGQHTVIATGTASGKSLCYQVPALAAALALQHDGATAGAEASGAGAAVAAGTSLYLCPTKALAADQLESLSPLAAELGVDAASYDGDTPSEVRQLIRAQTQILLTNPDMLHYGILPNHQQWAKFFARLRYVVVDEAHSYRGVFGTNMALVMRRLRRVAAHYGADPVFIGASATSADPASVFADLTGVNAEVISEDHSPRGEIVVGLWEPPLSDHRGEHGAPLRRSLFVESADLLAQAVLSRVRTLNFVRSRRGAETIASLTRQVLEEMQPALAGSVQAYRAGYLGQDRHQLEQAIKNGQLWALASTSALELGVDISGMDAVIISGWPGTRASFMQQLGRAGRGAQDAVALFIAGNDPIDAYFVHTPEAIFDSPVEDAVFDITNKHLLAPQLCAAAAELALTPENMGVLCDGDEDTLTGVIEQLCAQKLLRRRPSGWFWADARPASAFISLRSAGAGQYQIVEGSTGAVLGTMESGQVFSQAHPGAIYVHQGRSYLVVELDCPGRTVLVEHQVTSYYTQARQNTVISIQRCLQQRQLGPATLCFGELLVSEQVVSFQRKDLLTGENLGEEKLSLPTQELNTTGFWFTVPAPDLPELPADSLAGSLHAAEHAMIGLLPLIASCDRWDIGGVSIVAHPDTAQPTVFVYDGHLGGAGFAERGYHRAQQWLAATTARLLRCSCEDGCPSCVQSPKCGNRNHPLDKAGALIVLSWLLDQFPR